MTSINDNKNKSRNKSQQQPLPKDAEGLKQLVTAASAIGEIISLSEKYESVVFDNTSSSSLSSSAPLTHLSNLRAAFSQNPQLATLSCLKPTHAKFCKLGRVRSLRIGQSSTVADLIFVKFVALSNSGKICGPFDGPAYSSALRLILGLDSIVRMDDAADADANDNDNDNVDDNGNNNNTVKEVSDRSERALMKARILSLSINPAKLTNSIRFVWWLPRFALASLKTRFASFGAGSALSAARRHWCRPLDRRRRSDFDK